MIDPWKFNPLTILGNEAGKLSEMQYIKLVLSKEPQIRDSVIDFRERVKAGQETIIEDSKDLFL